MATIIQIPAINKEKKTETVLYPINDLYFLVKEYLGDEAAGIFDELTNELLDYREKEQQNE